MSLQRVCRLSNQVLKIRCRDLPSFAEAKVRTKLREYERHILTHPTMPQRKRTARQNIGSHFDSKPGASLPFHRSACHSGPGANWAFRDMAQRPCCRVASESARKTHVCFTHSEAMKNSSRTSKKKTRRQRQIQRGYTSPF